MKKFLFILSITALCFLTTYSFAVDTGAMYSYFATGKTGDLNFEKTTNTIYTILIVLGYGAAICITLFTAIQFLTANAQKKAQLKEKLWMLVLGVFVLVAGTTVLQIVVNIIDGVKSSI